MGTKQSRLPDGTPDDSVAKATCQVPPEKEKLLKYVRENIIGADEVFRGPFGLRKVTYFDYIASGRALTFLEEFVHGEVLPFYANTHTTTSVTSLQTTLFRHQARDIIRNSVNASEHDSVIFVGSGCTAAVHKLIHCLNLKTPPVVFVGPYEHHSNLLPWMEIGSKVIRIELNSHGEVDLDQLQAGLQAWQSEGRQLIGCFAAASNVTGILTDVMTVTSLLHRHGALALWDYATAAPYVDIDMNPVVSGPDQAYVYKDAVYFSVHKFIGGVSTPGVLVAKNNLFKNPVPDGCGGGTVSFVRRRAHRYLKEPEVKEEGGTPAIVESIRAGLVFQLKDAISAPTIMQLEHALARRAFAEWRDVGELVLLGPRDVARLPVFSFLVHHPLSNRFLHHKFIAALFNDLFGMQVRGGCACAGPYALDVMALDEETAEKFEKLILEDTRLDKTKLGRYQEYSDKEIFSPGFVRLNLPYFLEEECLQFVLAAVSLVARQGWRMLPQYVFDPENGEWRHKNFQVLKERGSLGHVTYHDGEMVYKKPPPLEGVMPANYQECLRMAENLLQQAGKKHSSLPDQTQMFDAEAEKLRWFLLPSEAEACLQGKQLSRVTPQSLPFCPDSLRCQLSADMAASQQKDRESGRTLASEELSLHLPPSPPAQIEEEEDSGHNSDGDAGSGKHESQWGWRTPPKSILNPSLQAVEELCMLQNGDRVLACVSGGLHSTCLPHVLHHLQLLCHSKGVHFDLGVVTLDPQTQGHSPTPLQACLAELGVPYFFESQRVSQTPSFLPDKGSSIASCLSRLTRGRLYATARREGYNVLALGHTLDDLSEREHDLRVIRPFMYVQEKDLRDFAEKERTRQLLAGQVLQPALLYSSKDTPIKPIMATKPIMGAYKTRINVSSLLATLSGRDKKEEEK